MEAVYLDVIHKPHINTKLQYSIKPLLTYLTPAVQSFTSALALLKSNRYLYLAIGLSVLCSQALKSSKSALGMYAPELGMKINLIMDRLPSEGLQPFRELSMSWETIGVICFFSSFLLSIGLIYWVNDLGVHGMISALLRQFKLTRRDMYQQGIHRLPLVLSFKIPVYILGGTVLGSIYLLAQTQYFQGTTAGLLGRNLLFMMLGAVFLIYAAYLSVGMKIIFLKQNEYVRQVYSATWKILSKHFNLLILYYTGCAAISGLGSLLVILCKLYYGWVVWFPLALIMLSFLAGLLKISSFYIYAYCDDECQF